MHDNSHMRSLWCRMRFSLFWRVDECTIVHSQWNRLKWPSWLHFECVPCIPMLLLVELLMFLYKNFHIHLLWLNMISFLSRFDRVECCVFVGSTHPSIHFDVKDVVVVSHQREEIHHWYSYNFSGVAIVVHSSIRPFARNLYAAASSMSKEGEREREGLSVQLYTQSGMGSICQIDFVQKYGWLANISVLLSVTIDILSFPIYSFLSSFLLTKRYICTTLVLP